ncbi:hypothetical protein RRG08_059265 [Elysia crispata]|uniref:Uncharacterized protein n=1 Tax=Elysia crispata TaxID=231223 RepID=A0AAE0Y8I0_9GAST|nr:hypothetical protein RRG08_059265 [Elysia crispata]
MGRTTVRPDLVYETARQLGPSLQVSTVYARAELTNSWHARPALPRRKLKPLVKQTYHDLPLSFSSRVDLSHFCEAPSKIDLKWCPDIQEKLTRRDNTWMMA